MLASVGTMFRSPVGLGRGNGTAAKVTMKGNKAYHVEVTVNEREPDDMALRRFRRLCGAAKVVYEVRRRRMFENRQDIKKRKMKERGLFKRVPDPDSWTDTKGTMEPSPFGDLFGEPQDIFAGTAEVRTGLRNYSLQGSAVNCTLEIPRGDTAIQGMIDCM